MRSETVKRWVDVLGAGSVLAATCPLLVAVGLGVRIAIGTPVLFRQQRPGYRGRPFEILKFRTMTNATDAAGRPLPDAQRLTRFGSFLRATSLDELPELINVLKGDMSLVGPRPLLMKYLPLYDERQKRRHDVKPGITGWQAVNGRNAVDWARKLEMDVWYVENWSLGLDLRILLATVAAVLRRDGISHDGSVTMPEFQGNASAAAGDLPRAVSG